MSYIEFKPTLKKVNLKPDGKKEIVLEVTDSSLNGKLDALSELIDIKVAVSLESLIVNYNVLLNAKTNKPLTEYEVDEKGFVQEVKQVYEQMEADFDIPEEKILTREEREQADRETVDAFIISGLAPGLDDLPHDFAYIVKRKLEGESYLKLANELKISNVKLIEMIDDYRARIAPMAIKWHEWKEKQPDVGEQSKVEEKPKEETKTEETVVTVEEQVQEKESQSSEEIEVTDEDKPFDETLED
ncbi:2-methylcitrate dehydratase [Bacillus cereus]|uniref:2-methylcitrate dehydratase n=1 Tax=Bacillus TaxID=1386 RepID=UPI000BECE386|nr:MULTISPECIES: 2-methylcitrate dehydratase [Bacillus cereus group]MEB9942694.1 2-methylcitrate dehydratase [Bacillus cereus]PDZ54175.1 2-methylcitrate dehydratase [Bacillus cereus]PEF50703.1 2-methylcitrate dehydratase [Bacillus thuringiensis]PEG01167.1 2-methylcitrate dehydratase [Bacillus cereus]PER09603.1 2-methylcitrate dehydratase [Bacillus cereus]